MNQTKMEVKKSIDSEVYTYCSLEDALSECHRITNKKTGVTVSLDSDQKLMYMRMRKRFHLFASMGNSFYDNVDVLADACGINLRTFPRKMPGLIEAGLIDKDDSLKSNSYTVADLTPNDFLLERKDKKLGWVDCLEYPVFGSKRPQEAPKVQVQETEAVTETSPQEPQQPERNPALPSSDDIHTSADSGSDDSQDEQQTESPPDDYCADDWLTDFQSEPDERSEDEELHNIYEEYKLYCDLEGIDYKAYQESFIQFMDKTMIDSRFEEFKNLGQYLFKKDWDEECDREIEGGYHQS